MVTMYAAPRFDSADTESVVQAVAESFNLPVDALLADSRGVQLHALARMVAMYLVHTLLGVSYKETGATFSRCRSTVAHACSTIEEMRDSRDFDQHVLELEQRVREATGCEIKPVTPARGAA